jgi:hypothetical protein
MSIRGSVHAYFYNREKERERERERDRQKKRPLLMMRWKKQERRIEKKESVKQNKEKYTYLKENIV